MSMTFSDKDIDIQMLKLQCYISLMLYTEIQIDIIEAKKLIPITTTHILTKSRVEVVS